MESKKKARIQSKDQSTRYANLIKAVMVIVLIGFLFVVYNRANAKDVPLSKIESNLRDKTNIEKLQKCNKRQLMQFIGLDSDDFDSFIYFKSREALGVDEVLIIKANKKADLTAARNAVDNRIAEQTKAFDGYGAKQVKELGNAVVFTKGKYIFYCVSDNSDKYEEVFRDAV